MRDGMLSWRNLIADQLQRINEKYAVPDDVSIETLADMFTSTIEGGIILTRNFGDNQLLVNQILAYRSFLRRLYE